MVFCIKFLIIVSSNNFYHNLLFLYISNIKAEIFEIQEMQAEPNWLNITKTGVGGPFGYRQKSI